MIEIPIFYKFHSREYFSFSDRILQTIIKYNAEELGLTTPIAKVQLSHDELKDALTKAVSKELTIDVVEADTLRDNSFIGLKYYLQACEKCNRPEWQEAASLLLTRIRHYGWTMNSASYSKQSAQTLSLLNDFETMPALVEAANTIQANTWVGDLKTAQSDFEQSLKVRTEAKASQVKITVEDSCKALRLAYEGLFKYIEALEIISPNEARKPMVDEFNTIITEFNTAVKTRQARLDNANQEETSEN